jgi:type IV secretion system protein VirB1
MSTALAAFFASCAPLVHPTTLAALIRVESAGHPYAVSLNHPERLAARGLDPAALIARQPTNSAEALSVTRQLLQQGLTTSVGLAQINIEHLTSWHRPLADLFDPCTNVHLAQRILLDCARAGAAGLDETLSCYNTGDSRDGLTNGYVRRLQRAARHPTFVKTRSSAQ